jgi:hypothetical protein
MNEVIANADNVFRGAHYPIAFSRRGDFQHSRFMKLFNDDNPRIIEASFVWQRFAPMLFNVHACGCRRSRKRNERQKNQKRRDIYCGAYHLKAESFGEIVGIAYLPEIASADLTHVIEDGEISHASYQVRLKDDAEEDSIEGIKTAIADHLWRRSRGALPHTCEADRELGLHPSGHLAQGPLGPFVEERTALEQLRDVARFWVLFVAWKMGLSRINARTG